MRACMYVFFYICVHFMYVCMHVYMLCMCTSMDKYMYTCMCLYVCMHIYMWMHMHFTACVYLNINVYECT